MVRSALLWALSSFCLRVISHVQWCDCDRFAGAKLNTCYNCLDRHVEDGAGDQTALIYDCAYTGQTNKFSYKRLTERVRKSRLYSNSSTRVLLTLDSFMPLLLCRSSCAQFPTCYCAFQCPVRSHLWLLCARFLATCAVESLEYVCQKELEFAFGSGLRFELLQARASSASTVPLVVRAGVQVGRRARAQVRSARWRPRSHLHAARAAGHHRDACVRASRRRALGGVRRLRSQRARHTRSARQSARSLEPLAAHTFRRVLVPLF